MLIPILCEKFSLNNGYFFRINVITIIVIKLISFSVFCWSQFHTSNEYHSLSLTHKKSILYIALFVVFESQAT